MALFTPLARKLALTAHVTSSVGWLGAVAAYLALALPGLASTDARILNAAFPSMELLGWSVVVPLALAALVTGVAQSLGTDWGLFRHYWVVAKFFLTVGATTILLMHMPAVGRMSTIAASTTLGSDDFGAERLQLVVHAAGGLVVLITTVALSVFKPWGRTRFAMAGQRGSLDRPASVGSDGSAAPVRAPLPRSSRWLYLVLGVAAFVLLFLVLHVIGGGAARH